MSNKIERPNLSFSFAQDSVKFIDLLKDKLGMGPKKPIEAIEIEQSDMDRDDINITDKTTTEAEISEPTPEMTAIADKENISLNPQPVPDTQRHGFSLARSVQMPGKVSTTTLQSDSKKSEFMMTSVSVSFVENIPENFTPVVLANHSIDTAFTSTNNMVTVTSGIAAPHFAAIVPVPVAIAQQVPSIVQLPQPKAYKVPTATDVAKPIPAVVKVEDPSYGVKLGSVIEQIMLDHFSADSDQVLDVTLGLLGLDDDGAGSDIGSEARADISSEPRADIKSDDNVNTKTEIDVGLNPDFDISSIPQPTVVDGPIPVIDTSHAPLPLPFFPSTAAEKNVDVDATLLDVVPQLDLPLLSSDDGLLASAKLEVSATVDSDVSHFSPPPPPPSMDANKVGVNSKPKSLLEQIESGPTLKSVAKAVVAPDHSRGSLLDQIKAGKTLKKVEPIDKAEVLDKAPEGLLGALLDRLDTANNFVQYDSSSSSSDTDSGSGWSEEDDDYWNMAPEGLESSKTLSQAPDTLTSSAGKANDLDMAAKELPKFEAETSELIEADLEETNSIQSSSTVSVSTDKSGISVPVENSLDTAPEKLSMAELMQARRHKMGEDDDDSVDDSDESWDDDDTVDNTEVVKLDTEVSDAKSDFFTNGRKALANLFGASSSPKAQVETTDTNEGEQLDTAPGILDGSVEDVSMTVHNSFESPVEQPILNEGFM
tara:strand:- start:29247 stop:31373 length:2127 start_codon:yes stop_codon:yes gene_type:complete